MARSGEEILSQEQGSATPQESGSHQVRAEGRHLPIPLLYFAMTVLGLSCLSLLFEVACGIRGLPYPYTSPLVGRVSYFDDLLDWMPHMSLFHTREYIYTPGMVAYTAPGQVLYWLFSLAREHALMAYLWVTGGLSGAAILAFGERLHRAGIKKLEVAVLLVVLLITSYPLVFLVTTANLEVAVWALSLLAVWAYATGRHRLAAIIVGLAMGMKYYPAALLLLYLNRKEWKRILEAAVTFLVVTFASLWLIYPSIPESWNSIYGSSGTTANFVKEDCLNFLSWRSGFDHSLWSLYKVLTSPWTSKHTEIEMLAIVGFASLAVFTLWLVRVQHMGLWERITFLASAMLLLMPMSNDYRLMQLYIPFGLLAQAITKRRVGTGLAAATLGCFAVLFTAQGFMIVDYTSFAAQVKTFALLGIVIAVTCWGPRADVERMAAKATLQVKNS